ncbi:MAG TPA: ATP-binding protein, partial [Bacteroidia bacterium]|nr:ATP-binding protein [Bacteroidia bacterium]
DVESSRKIAEMKTNFETEKRDKEIQLLNKDKKLKEQESKQQGIIKKIFIVSFFAALLIAGLFFNRYRFKQRSNKIITRAYEDLKKAQEQLIQSEKMASLGQLTAGVAHEINNPINFVSANVNPLKRNFAELIDVIKNKKTLNADELNYTINETHELLTGIEEGSRRTAEIVIGLRNFSRLDEEEMKKASINEGIHSTLVLLKSKLKQNNIEVINLFDDLPEIECYPGKLNQVFMNIISNAIDAISENGKIIITTSKENDRIKISICDNGKGMSREVKQKIFDPFFTTKDVGKGTGLGLSISYGIIEKHKGNIEVNSEVGKGSEFLISLPAAYPL